MVRKILQMSVVVIITLAILGSYAYVKQERNNAAVGNPYPGLKTPEELKQLAASSIVEAIEEEKKTLLADCIKGSEFMAKNGRNEYLTYFSHVEAADYVIKELRDRNFKASRTSGCLTMGW